MRALAGLVVGAVAATAVVAFAGVFLGRHAVWAAIAAGLVAGLVMRALASGSGFPYLKGGLAVAATAVAAIGGQMLVAQWFVASANAKPAMPAATAVAGADDEAVEDIEASGPAYVPSADAEQASRLGIAGGDVAPINPGGGLLEDPAYAVSLVIGCLLAYQSGKGAAAKTAAEGESDVATPESDAVAEDEGAAGAAPAV